MLEKEVQLDIRQLTQGGALRRATPIRSVQPLIEQGCTVQSTGLMHSDNVVYTDYTLGLTTFNTTVFLFTDASLDERGRVKMVWTIGRTVKQLTRLRCSKKSATQLPMLGAPKPRECPLLQNSPGC